MEGLGVIPHAETLVNFKLAPVFYQVFGKMEN